MRPVAVQIITYTPTVFYHCQHCEVTFSQTGVGSAVHKEQSHSALPDDLRQEFHILSDSVHDLVHRYGDHIAVKVIDAASMEGFFKSLRHRVRKYPAVIVNGRHKREGIDVASLEPVIKEHMTIQSDTG
jgi:hypothetical protein